MIVWFSSESTPAVSREFFASSSSKGACNEFEQTINRYMPKIAVQDWKEWRVIFIILPESLRQLFPETRRLTRKDMSLDFRVAIDFEKAKYASFVECIDLMLTAIEKTIPYFKKAGITEDIQQSIRLCVREAADEVKASVSAKH